MMWFRERNDLVAGAINKSIIAATKVFDLENMELEILNSGNPVAYKVYAGAMKAINKIRHPRQLRNFDLLVKYAIHKAIFDGATRPVFYDMLAEIYDAIDREELERYRKDPKNWKINIDYR